MREISTNPDIQAGKAEKKLSLPGWLAIHSGISPEWRPSAAVIATTSDASSTRTCIHEKGRLAFSPLDDITNLLPRLRRYQVSYLSLRLPLASRDSSSPADPKVWLRSGSAPPSHPSHMAPEIWLWSTELNNLPNCHRGQIVRAA
ncbi:hypothetical protein TgHK011_008600 [Trichoderma gracile]|nr:hypothetical protein TgHK011_008600 [Trichoderma gracile]